MSKEVIKDKRLISLVGIVAATLLYSSIPKHEGVVLKGYLDPVGIPTKCMGDTNDVEMRVYSLQECLESMSGQLYEHAVPVLKCTPSLKGRPEMLAAAVSFAYNIGTDAYCKSGTARAFNAGNYALGCKRMNENDLGKPQWISARGKVLPGLVKRRAEERVLCESGLVD